MSADKTSGPGWSARHLWEIKPLQDLFWIGLAVALIWFGYFARGVFVPILIGLGLAYVVNPLLSFCERRWKLPRPATIGLILGGLTLAVATTLYFVVPMAVSEARTLSQKAPGYAEVVASRLNSQVDDELLTNMKELSQRIPANGAKLAQSGLSNLGVAMGVVSDVASTTFYAVAVLCLIPIYFFFFAWHFNPMLDRAKGLIPGPQRDRVLEILSRMDDAVGSFLRGRFIIVLAMMGMFSLGYWIAGVPYWFLLGCLTGLLSFVPYFAVVGCVLAIAVKWVDVSSGSGAFDWIDVFVWPAGAYSVVQLLEGWVLTPWIQSKSMQMNPVGVLIVVLIGGSVAGLYGLLLAIPVAGCTRILCEELLLPKLEAWAADA